ncbi:MAG: hypothetical protein BWY74_00908 [Firmicutes bacterium ADurb.Bin419]|nr:MAG: hypothetical protein BWY74_00908 [Firmicutes bacterium ADurb.Bin419]
MNNRMGIPDFQPPEKQDSVRFYVLKNLSYPIRMMLYLLLVAVGFSLQILMMTVWPGVIFLALATVLNIARGFDSGIKLKTFDIDSNWTQVELEQLRRIKELDKEAKKWRDDSLNANSGKGMVLLVITLFGLMFVSVVLGGITGINSVRKIFMTDVVVILLPFWFMGIRKTFEQGKLIIKVNIIIKLEEFFRTIKLEGENFKPALMLARSKVGKCIPTDGRFSITFDNMPADFYGVQAQININSVQGSSYPYFYCVIAAGKNFELEKYRRNLRPPKKVIIEFQKEINADVIVIRQLTTNTSGYHTKMNDCMNILEFAVSAARMILEQSMASSQ